MLSLNIPQTLTLPNQCLSGGKVRCVGSALSPNGIAFSNEAMLSLSLMDKILHIDSGAKQVTVQAGARVQEVVEALRPHGLTLQNYASIREQSIGGFTQVGQCRSLQRMSASCQHFLLTLLKCMDIYQQSGFCHPHKPSVHHLNMAQVRFEQRLIIIALLQACNMGLCIQKQP